MRYSWLLFDADGTLFDFEEGEALALAATFRQFGHQVDASHLDLYRRINRQVWLDFEQGQISAEDLRTARFERLFDALGLQMDPQPFSERYLGNLAQRAELVNGAENIVRLLSKSHRLFLITNGLSQVQRPRLARSTISRYFAGVVISEEVGVAKPDPKIFDIVFEGMGHPPKADVLIIGDSLTSDMQGGFDYGIDTCWYNPNGKPPQPQVAVSYEIRHLDELIPIVHGAARSGHS